MAYTVTGPTRRKINGVRHWHVVIVETAARDTSEWVVEGLPKTGVVTLLRVTPSFGTGTTVRPLLGREASWVYDDDNHIGRVTAADTTINEAEELHFAGLDSAGRIYGRTGYNTATADNGATIELVVREGH
jgi:hypothetical protein